MPIDIATLNGNFQIVFIIQVRRENAKNYRRKVKIDLISTVPSRIAAHFAQVLPIVVYDPPLALPAPDIALYWHPRSQDDPGHKWLRGKITALLKA